MKEIFRLLTLLAVSVSVSSCVTDASKEPPHNQLVDTVWRLKTDSYLVKFSDSKQILVVPCIDAYTAYFPGEISGIYSESNFGAADSETTIKGGLRSGQLLRITKIEKKWNPETSNQYDPIAVADDMRNGNKELCLSVIYDAYKNGGMLNPRYAERVR